MKNKAMSFTVLTIGYLILPNISKAEPICIVSPCPGSILEMETQSSTMTITESGKPLGKVLNQDSKELQKPIELKKELLDPNKQKNKTIKSGLGLRVYLG